MVVLINNYLGFMVRVFLRLLLCHCKSSIRMVFSGINLPWMGCPRQDLGEDGTDNYRGRGRGMESRAGDVGHALWLQSVPRMDSSGTVHQGETTERCGLGGDVPDPALMLTRGKDK